MISRPWFIYALKDPRTQEVRYVGWTVSTRKQLNSHCCEARRKAKTY
jgi:hypothetical protein